MASSVEIVPGKFIVDPIHGDIHLTEVEWKVIDTPSFQRLRRLKQLQMAQITYPNATHTRFAHSLGALGVMAKILDVTKGLGLNKTDQENLRLAALLHDVGHYPYSHLMEGIDKVELTEELIQQSTNSEQKTFTQTKSYPSHVDVGRLIVTEQVDIIKAIGGKERAKEIAAIFSGSSPLSKLITSSLDLDRMDFLLRDSCAAGVPYGQVDINYLLNNLKTIEVDEEKKLGISRKAIPAAEQFLLARFFMHRCVYFHKTTYGLEEACRQLLRRVRDAKKYDFPQDGDEVETMVKDPQKLSTFTDSFVDNIVQEAVGDNDKIIDSLAKSIQSRKPPKLLKEVLVWTGKDSDYHAGSTFRQKCKQELQKVADEHKIPIELFLWCEPKPVTLEKAEARMTAKEAEGMTHEEIAQRVKEEDEIIKVFESEPPEKEPTSLVNIKHSIISRFAGNTFKIFRLYVVCDDKEKIKKLSREVQDWHKPSA